MYCKYHENDLLAITSRLKGHLLIFDNKNLDVHLGGKGVQKGKKVHENRQYCRKKCHFQVKISNFKGPSKKCATRWEVSHIWARVARRVISENTSHIPGSFRERGEAPLDGVSGGVITINEVYSCFNYQIYIGKAYWT